MKKLTITIPAKNEEKTLPSVVTEIYNVVKTLQYEWSIQVVDDGSKDRTRAVCEAMNIRCVSLPRSSGLASVFRKEIEVSLANGADIIVHIDADGQYDPKEIPKLLNKIEAGYDLALGSRFLGRIEEMPTVKKLGNIAFSRVISSIIKQKITDGQTGFRAFTRKLAEDVKIQSTHTYTQEQIIRSALKNYNIVEVPVVFRKRTAGQSRLIRSPFEYAFKAWINILRTYRDFEPLQFFGVFGFLVLLPGLALLIRLLYLHFTIGISGRIFSMMLMVLFFITGLQILLFGFLADMRKE